jgi:hypothetical protein
MTLAQNELQASATAFRTAWTTTAVNYDCTVNDPLRSNTPGLSITTEGRPCRWITATGGAGLVLNVIGLDGVAVSLPATQTTGSQRFDIQVQSLASTSTVTNVVVYW